MQPTHRAVLAVLIASCMTVAGLGQTPAASEVRVFVPDEAALINLIALDLDLIPHQVGPRWFPVIVYGPDQLSALTAAGFEFKVVHEDLTAYLQAGLLQPRGSGFPSGSMGGYFTFDEMVAAFDALVAAHPTLIAPKVSLGLSYEGRPIWMWKISDNPLVDENEPEVLFDALHHAREPAAMMSLYWFVTTILDGYATDPELSQLIDNRELYLVPCVNPDGYVYNQTTNPTGGGLWRKNRRANAGGTFGVDLNRNYPYQWGYDDTGSSPNPSSELYRGAFPASESETQAMTAFGIARSFALVESLHTYGGFHLIPFGHVGNSPSPLQASYLEWGERMSRLSGYRTGTTPQILYLINGSSKDWWEGTQSVPAISTEMGHENDGFWPPTARILPIATDNFPTFFEWSWIAGSHVVMDSVVLHPVSGNGDTWPEAGEVFDVEVVLRNVGKAATSGVVNATAQATTPYAQLQIASSSTAAAIPSRTNGSVTFRILVGATIPRAAPLSLLVTWTFDGITRSAEAEVTAGPIQGYVSDTFEGPTGWTVGAPGDTGTGAWLRLNPNGTFYPLVQGGSTQWQPEDDHTPSGTQCWVTGNGGSATLPGSADVDGITTLTSPTYDLGQVLLPEVRIWLWFANDDHDDALTVSVSNDDGISWITMEEVRGWKNAWTQHRYRLNDFLLPTNKMKFRFRASDDPNNSTTEAAIDDFEIVGYPALLVLGAASASQPIPFALTSSAALAGRAYAIGVSTSAINGIPLGDGRVAGIDDTPVLGLVFSLPQTFVSFIGTLNQVGTASALLAINDPGLSGIKFFASAVTAGPGPIVFREISGTLLITVP